MSIKENVIKLRNLTGISQEELGKIADVSRGAVSLWEIGKTEPRMGSIQRMSDYFGIRKACLIEDGGMDFVHMSHSGHLVEDVEASFDAQMTDVPLYGSIAAGVPIEMMEVENAFPIPRAIHRRYPDAFLLKVEGDSMNILFKDGSYVLVDPCDDVEYNGQPYAVCVNGYAATVKRVRKLSNGFELVPESTDPTYRPVVFDYGTEGTETITVIGRVVWDTKPFDWTY